MNLYGTLLIAGVAIAAAWGSPAVDRPSSDFEVIDDVRLRQAEGLEVIDDVRLRSMHSGDIAALLRNKAPLPSGYERHTMNWFSSPFQVVALDAGLSFSLPPPKAHGFLNFKHMHVQTSNGNYLQVKCSLNNNKVPFTLVISNNHKYTEKSGSTIDFTTTGNRMHMFIFFFSSPNINCVISSVGAGTSTTAAPTGETTPSGSTVPSTESPITTAPPTTDESTIPSTESPITTVPPTTDESSIPSTESPITTAPPTTDESTIPSTESPITTVPPTTEETTAPQTTINPNSCRCGKRQQQPMRIVGGTKADPREFPWQIGLVRSYGAGRITYPICGGTIISERYVVTAAHCTAGVQSGGYTFAIHYGSDSRIPSRETLVDVEAVIDHPGYNDGKSLDHDISLLRLAQPLKFSNDVSPACFPTVGRDLTGEIGIITGWGDTSDGGQPSNDLLKVELPIISTQQCARQWYNQLTYPDGKLCCEASRQKDSCQGDSGGPLVTELDGSYELSGVVSYGQGCASSFPGVYTRVGHYMSWIESVIAGDKTCPR